MIWAKSWESAPTWRPCAGPPWPSSAAEQSHTLEQIAESASQGRIAELLIHPRRILPEIPSVTASDEDVGKIRHGRTVNLPEMSRSPFVKVFAGQTDLVCIASRVAGTLFHPKVVLLT